MATLTTNTVIIKKIIDDVAKYGFTPSKPFYDEINVNRKRWGLLLLGTKEPTINELKAICNYFEVDIKNYI